MAHPRMAFTAEFWNDRAVVCRATENHVGCSVVQEFGAFQSWTEANQFANKLNEGLGLSPEEARELVAASLLAVSDRLRIAVRENQFWDLAPVIVRAHSLQVRSIVVNLELARTFCHIASCREPCSKIEQLVQTAARALDSALAHLPQLRLSRDEAEELFIGIELLKTELHNIPRRIAES